MIVPVRSDLTAHSSSIKKKMMENDSIFIFLTLCCPSKRSNSHSLDVIIYFVLLQIKMSTVKLLYCDHYGAS